MSPLIHPWKPGFNDFDVLERALQARPKRIKRFTVKGFDHENAVGFNHLRESSRLLRQARASGAWSTLRIPDRFGDRSERTESARSLLSISRKSPGGWSLRIWGRSAKGQWRARGYRLYLLRGHLRPATRRRAEIDNRLTRTEQLFPGIDFKELESGARAIAITCAPS